MGWLLTFFIILGIFTVSSCCPGTSVKFGSMTKDYDLEVGETLTVRCSLFENVIPINGTKYFVNSQNLVIKFGNKFLQNLTTVDDYTVEYVLQDANVNDTGTYYCFLSIPQLKVNPFVCTTDVSVGYKPQNVSNFSCIVYGYERLNCSWVKPFNPVNTKYTLLDLVRGFRRPCPVALENSCEFRLDTKPPYRKSPKILNMLLVGNNSLGEFRLPISIHHFKIVKPHAPQRINLTNVTRNSVFVHWQMPKGMEYNEFLPGLTFRLTYCPLFGNYPELCGIISQQNDTSVLVSHLVPYMEYKFTLRCRSNVAEGDDMWSPFTNASIRTEADVPYLAPVITASAFEVQNSQSSRTITLYWKSIPSYNENGGNFEYEISYHKHYVASRSKRETPLVIAGNKTSHKFLEMDSESAYYFKIFARNAIGKSSNWSSIVVDKVDSLIEGPSEVSVIYSGGGKYNISWKDNEPNIKNYTLFWCQNIKPWPFDCEGPIEWVTVFGREHALYLPDSNTNYQFAVAANTENSTSGLKWASCFIPHRGVLSKITNIDLFPKNSTSIRVSWKLDCSAQKSVVKEYEISYCPIDANESCAATTLVRFNSTLKEKEEYLIGGLQPYTRYKVTVAARTADGWSEKSSVKNESTLSGAPSDSPHDLQLISVNGTVIKIAFKPPHKPNGRITHYVVYYWDSTIPSDYEEPSISVENCSSLCKAEINRTNIHFYTNYSIEVKACVGLQCSPRSHPIYAMTDIAAPGLMEAPHLEIFNTTLVNITWNRPSFPNGPIDLYQLKVARIGDEYSSIFNISGHDNYFSLEVTCDDQSDEGVPFQFQIRAINLKNNISLYGSYSEEAKTQMCLIGSGLPYALLVGLVFGIAFGLAALVISMYAFAKWMKKTVDQAKGIIVQLPDGLDSPSDNPLHKYNNFKNGLVKIGESGIPNDTNYDPQFTYLPNKQGKEEMDNTFDATAEELVNSQSRREKSGRNQSGDSNISGKGHDSISSAQTNKTLLSIDSGAEVDLPPSPDGMFSDTSSSSNTTPRSYKPDLESVEENHPTNSTDSGLANGNTSPIINAKRILEQSAHLPCHIKMKKGINHKSGQMPPYSRFSIFSPVFMPSYASFGVHNVHLLEQQSLANSEPSVADFQDDSDSEPLVSGAPPYCRFGLARSAGNGLNIARQSVPVQENLGYSKFGIIYSALGKPASGSNQTTIVAPNYSKIACPRFMQSGIKNGCPSGQPFPGKQQLKAVKEQAGCSSTEQVNYFNTASDPQKHSSREKLILMPSKPSVGNGYVSFSHAISDTNPVTALASNPEANSAEINYNSAAVVPGLPKTDVSSLPSELQPPASVHSKPAGYVSFQNAKAMSLSEPNTSSCSNNLQTAPDNVLLSDQMCGNTHLSEELEEDEDPKEDCGLLVELSNLRLPNEEEFVPPNEISNGLISEECGNTPPDVSNPFVTQDLNRCGSEDQTGDPLDLSDISLVDMQPQTDISSPLHVTSSSPPVAIKQQKPSNGYVVWTELLGANPSEGTNASHAEHV